jgi:predicted DNA-binding protein (MmcQ/YjbR family)
MAKQDRLSRAEAALRDHALAYPEAHEDFPWGHRVVKVKGKIFLTLHQEGGSLNLSVKLPLSGRISLTFPFASPTGYGLGKSGWVTAKFAATDDVPVDMLREWVDESFRAIAPKRVLAKLESADEARPERREGPPKPKRKRPKKRTSK